MRVFPLALHLVRWKLTVVQLYWFKLCPKTMPFVPRQFVYFGSTTCKSFLFVGFARLFLPPVLARQPANHQNTASSSAQRMAAMPLCLIMNVGVLKQDRDYGRETKCCKQKISVLLSTTTLITLSCFEGACLPRQPSHWFPRLRLWAGPAVEELPPHWIVPEQQG